jgi:hypothetical protein
MASRTVNEIFESLIDIKEITPELSGATSTSNTALWRVFYQTVANGIAIFEQLQDAFKTDLEAVRDSAQIYNEAWWNQKMTDFFQYDPLDSDVGVLKISDNFVPFYTTEDETAKIIDFCSTTRAEGRASATIKIAKDAGDGTPEQLTLDELNAAKGFTNKMQGAGLLINVVSFPGDELKLDIDIYYKGDGVETVVEQQVIDSIELYLKDALTFDGKIKILTLVDFLQNNIPSLDDLEITKATILPDGGNDTVFTRATDTKAGYAVFDVENSNINLIAV